MYPESLLEELGLWKALVMKSSHKAKHLYQAHLIGMAKKVRYNNCLGTISWMSNKLDE